MLWSDGERRCRGYSVSRNQSAEGFGFVAGLLSGAPGYLPGMAFGAAVGTVTGYELLNGIERLVYGTDADYYANKRTQIMNLRF